MPYGKGRQGKTFDDFSDDDDDMPSCDEFASLVKEQNKVLGKMNAKLEKAKIENKSLMLKCNELVTSYDHGKFE